MSSKQFGKTLQAYSPDMPFSLKDAVLPSYLTEERRDALRRELERFPHNLRYFLERPIKASLQGDLVAAQPYVVIAEKKPKLRATQIMVISNSCDIALENDRALPVSVLVAPVGPLAALKERLNSAKLTNESVESRISAIRRQENTSTFFLPAGSGLTQESVVYLDAIQSIPRGLLSLQQSRIATLSQYGFYLLLIKLSFHLCRAKEGIDREAA